MNGCSYSDLALTCQNLKNFALLYLQKFLGNINFDERNGAMEKDNALKSMNH